MIKVTVITPSFQQAPFLSRCLESVGNQTYRNIEHLIIDPGSSDGSLEIIDKHLERSGNAVSIIGQDKSQMDAINIGFSRATGDLITWLNSDDYYLDAHAIESIVESIIKFPSFEVYYGRGQYVSSEGKYIKDAYVNRSIVDPVLDFKDKIGILQPALFFRQSIVRLMGGLDLRYNLSLDYEYWLRIAHAGLRFKFVDAKIAGATLHDDSKSCSQRGKQYKEIFHLQLHYYGYIHRDWLRRRAQFILEGLDGILNYEGYKDNSRIERLVERYDKVFNKNSPLNRGSEATRALTGGDGRSPFSASEQISVSGGNLLTDGNINWIRSNGGLFPRSVYNFPTQAGMTYRFSFDFFYGGEVPGFIAISKLPNIQDAYLYIEGLEDTCRISHEFVAQTESTFILIGLATTLAGKRFGIRSFNIERVLPRLRKTSRSSKKNQKRLIVTSFNAAYFEQGLTLINSVARTSRTLVDHIYVFDLGLNLKQRAFLESLDTVTLLDYPEARELPYPEYLEPKNYSYKCHAFAEVAKLGKKGDLILWLDSGVAPVQPLDEIFYKVNRRGYFFVDHNEVAGWPIFNSSFTQPESLVSLRATVDDLMGKHLCSAVMGYKVGSKYNQLVEEARNISHSKEAIVWSKHPPEPIKHFGKGREQKEAILRSPRRYSVEEITQTFPFFGHRQDQSVFSILAAKYGCKLDPGITYRRGSKFSSYISKKNWQSGGEYFLNRFVNSLEDVDEETVIFQHRGVYKFLYQNQFFKRKSEVLVILGNGPSLAEHDLVSFTPYDTVGCNSAYRYWDEVKWYPTFYACLDETVMDSHKYEIKRLIESRRENGIRLFFLRRSILNHFPELSEELSVILIEDLFDCYKGYRLEPITTGSHSTLLALYLGYKKVAIYGVDLNYVEKVEGAENSSGTELVITKDSDHNPNYFFKGYQKEGDRFNIPNPSKNLHLRAWKNIKAFLEQSGIILYNGNPSSRLRNTSQLTGIDLQSVDKADYKCLFDDFKSLEPIATILIPDIERSLSVRDITASLLGLRGDVSINFVEYTGGKNLCDQLIPMEGNMIILTERRSNHKRLCKQLESFTFLPQGIGTRVKKRKGVREVLDSMQLLGYFTKICVFSDRYCELHNDYASVPQSGEYLVFGTKTPIPHNLVMKSLSLKFEFVPVPKIVLNRKLVFENFRRVFESSYEISQFESAIVATRWCPENADLLKVIVATPAKVASIRITSCDAEVIAESVYCHGLQSVVPFDQEGLNGQFLLKGRRGLTLDLVINKQYVSTWKVTK